MKMLLSAVLAFGLVTGVTAQDEKEEPTTKAESEDGIKDILKKAADYKSYTYTSKTETEGLPNRGGGGGGGQGGGGEAARSLDCGREIASLREFCRNCRGECAAGSMHGSGRDIDAKALEPRI